MNVLLIAYYYPPINSGGTERPLKMAKYLPRFGHEVNVLTHSYKKNALYTGSVLRIYDISHNKHRKGIYKGIWCCLRGYTELLNLTGIYHSIYSFWKDSVIRNAERIISQCEPDVILATYPPVEDFEIGLYLSQRYHLPLVADFRDGLLFEPIEITRINRYTCIQRAYQNIEREVAQKSSAIITVSPPITEYFIRTYHCKNVITIPNGFDWEDFKEVSDELHLDPEKFHIVHTGRFGGSYAGRNITPFVNALRKLVSDHSQIQEKLRLHLIGHIEKKERVVMQDLISNGTIVYHGLQERNTTLSFQVKADLLLLMTAVNRRSMVTAKLPEYLGANRPIFALTFQTYAEEIIKTTGTGWTVHPQDEEKIYQLLYNIILDTSFYQSLTPSTEEIAKFSREKQMEKLSEIL